MREDERERDVVVRLFEQRFKNASYLMIAHGAGLIACLATLKDYESTPHLKGIGTFIELFGLGLIAAVCGYGGLSALHIMAIDTKVLSKVRHPRLLSGYAAFLWLGSLAPSLILLLIAIALLIYRLKGL